MATNPRKLALDVLLRFEKGGAARLKADSLLAELSSRAAQPLSEPDRALAHALVMGTLRRWLQQDEWIQDLTGRLLKQIAPPVRVLLRLGLFQLADLSQVPAYAAINTTVELAKAQKLSAPTVRFVNAVLRAGQRKLAAGGFAVPDFEADPAGHLLRAAAWPKAFSERLLRQYAPDEVLAMAQASQTPAPLSIRVNTLKTSPTDYQVRLQAAGLESSAPDPALPEYLLITRFSGSPRQLPGYEEGWFYVQDPASMGVARLLSPQPTDAVLDLCAAPGSKATHLAALMENAGSITAIEPKPERLALLQENLARLGVRNVQAVQADGLMWAASDGEALYDKVLVDAPCSGSGTLRRHPEILLALRQLNLKAYQKQQSALLQKGFDLLKPGGMLVYSTCSLLREENHDIVARLLQDNPSARLQAEEQRRMTPNADGFYAARIQKKSDD